MFDYASMEPHARNVILRAFEQFPDYDFVWKFQDTKNNSSTLPEVPPNVHMFKWIDQKVVLGNHFFFLLFAFKILSSINFLKYKISQLGGDRILFVLYYNFYFIRMAFSV